MCVSLATTLSNVTDQNPKVLYQTSCASWCSIQWDNREMATLNGKAWKAYLEALILGEAPPNLASLGDVARSAKEKEWKTRENSEDTALLLAGTLIAGGVGGQLIGKYNQQTQAGLENRCLLVWGLIDAIGRERFAQLPRHDLTKLKPREYPKPAPLAVGYIRPKDPKKEMKVLILVQAGDSRGKPQTLSFSPHPTLFAWEGKAVPPDTVAYLDGMYFQRIEPYSCNYPKLIALIKAAAAQAFPKQS